MPFSAQARKRIKIHSENISHIIPKNRNISYTSGNGTLLPKDIKNFSCILGNKILKKLLMFQGEISKL